MEKGIETALQSMSGKKVLITGGTTGIGRATAILLASLGARIFILGREKEPLEDALEAIREHSQEVDGINADVSRPEDVQRVFEEALSFLGGLDILVNNAAISAKGLAEIGENEWRYVIESNLSGYLACSKAAVAHLRGRNGHILCIGSMSAESEDAGSSVYVATKSALRGFCASFQKEVNKEGIKVSLIEPGLVGSDMIEKSPEEQREWIDQLKMLRAEDIAQCVHYVLSQPLRCDVVFVQIRPHLEGA